MSQEVRAMSWKETGPMDEKVRFIADVLSGELSFTEACRRRGISRKTGYKLWQRYRGEGHDGLQERSRAPLHHPNAVDAQVLARVLAARRRHPSWGARNLIDWLARQEPQQRWPAPSTVGEILWRHGLIQSRRRRRRSPAYAAPLVQPDRPNALWCADFKGQWRLGDGTLCYPLTVSDSFSRSLLLCRGLPRTHAAAVRPWMERLFRERGLPLAIRTDNGAPFASVGLAGLSQLSAWWVRLGIWPERIAPGHPEQNGRHERLHRTLAAATVKPWAANLAAQQRRFERFCAEYNQERSHEALGRRTPAEVYERSSRPYPRRLPPLEYPSHYEVRHVKHSGEIAWRGQLIYVSQALAGEPVGLHLIEEARWALYYGMLKLGTLDTRVARDARIEPNTPPSSQKVLPMCPV
jgi:transposase InsO family protein